MIKAQTTVYCGLWYFYYYYYYSLTFIYCQTTYNDNEWSSPPLHTTATTERQQGIGQHHHHHASSTNDDLDEWGPRHICLSGPCFFSSFSIVLMYIYHFNRIFFYIHLISASRSGPVPVLSPSGLEPRTGPVPESFRNQGPRTRTAKNRKKPVQTGCNRFCNKYIKMRHIPAKSGLGV